MEFSVWPNVAHPPSHVLDLVRWVDARSEAQGWCGVWVADHYMPNTGSEEIRPGPVHECWAMLPAIAAVTEHVRLGSLVAPTSVHHPALLANRASTIDHISNGRMVLGLGAGWQINEHHAYGIPLEPARQRVDRFDEAIQIVRSLLAEDRTTFEGEHYTVRDAPADPKPIQSPLPILVGTGSPRMLRITARHADEWNTWGAPAEAAARYATFAQACEREGVDPASKRRSVQALPFIATTDAEREAASKGPFAERSIVGSPDELVDLIGNYAEIGFDEFIVPVFHFGPELAGQIEGIDRLHAEVLSQL